MNGKTTSSLRDTVYTNPVQEVRLQHPSFFQSFTLKGHSKSRASCLLFTEALTTLTLIRPLENRPANSK